MNVNWNRVTDTQSGVDRFRVQCENTGSSTISDTLIFGQSVLFEDLVNGTEYRFRVQAVDSAENKSNWSEWVSTTIDTVSPGIPVLRAEPEYTPTDSNTIAWSPVRDNLDSVRYFVEICNDTAFNPYDSVATTYYDTSQGWIQKTEYTFRGLENDTHYYYRVIAADNAGNRSEWSNIAGSAQDYDMPYPPVIDPQPEYTAGTGSMSVGSHLRGTGILCPIPSSSPLRPTPKMGIPGLISMIPGS
ncbi:MAG: fibronectin type III domain-containing protein [Candidatus Marinimicrobia bacterium]|nr:fibronectin type III domain-containing protein [Candidatus Neomarinimicrobiota bacterium]